MQDLQTRRMRTLCAAALLGGSAIGTQVDGAVAADLPVKAPLAAPVFIDWSGAYVGVHAGYGGGMTDWAPSSGHFPAEGFLAGGQIGINKQIASLVFGVELEGSWTNIGGSKVFTTGSMGPFFGGISTDAANSRIDGMATVAGRAGLAADRWFVFAKGGLTGAWQKHSSSFAHSDIFGLPRSEDGSAREFRLAPMVGFGAEYALDGNWSLKAEYDFIHFGTRGVPLTGTSVFNGIASPVTSTASITQDAIHLVKLGANYRFGGMPVDSAYPPVKPASGSGWTGAYVGVQGGYGFGQTEWPSYWAGNGSYDATGWLAGFNGGVNVRSGVFVFGAEAEWMWTGIRGSQTITGVDTAFGGTVVNTFRSSIDWLAIASARAGFVVGERLLVYGKGGIAIASERHSVSSVETFTTTSDVFSMATSGSAVHSGLAVGAGAEYALGGNWSIKGEYNYIKMLAQTHVRTGIMTLSSAFSPDQGPIAPFNTVGQDLHLFKLGVNYHFNAVPGTVSARY